MIIVRIAASATAMLRSPSELIKTKSRFLFLVSTPRIVTRKGGTLTVKQLATSVRCAPLAVGSQVHANLKNCSPGKHVGSDRKSQAAVNRLVRKKRKGLMAAHIPDINLDQTEGAMIRIAPIPQSNPPYQENPSDPYHIKKIRSFGNKGNKAWRFQAHDERQFTV
jgi:hypothetical protein